MAHALPDPPAPGDFERAVEWMRTVRDLHVPRREGEGLREYKKRLTRQQISDTATWMFAEHGFDQVRIADVAAKVGVSEKTVYNYFPTKESLVFDREDDVIASVVGALRDRPAGTSPVSAVLAAMEEEHARFAEMPEEALWMLQAFDDLLTSTPALIAHQRTMTRRLTAAIAEVLAEQAELDPRDPEPQIVAQALVGLWETSETSFSRHVDEGRAGPPLADAVRADLARAARVLETGLWAFDHIGQSRRTRAQMEEMMRSLDGSRRQIGAAVREAREAWARAARNHRR